jgi:glycerol-3-phosphate dehydrogenase
VDRIVEQGSAMVPVLESARYIRAYAGVRPLARMESGEDDRSVSRGFTVFDHERDGVKNFITITGGKLTTYRLMAEKAADLVCRKLGISTPCLTRTVPLPATETCGWSYPDSAPKAYMKMHDPKDILLCECEMVPKSVVDSITASILQQGGSPSFESVALRSRLGKGSCQGTFCSIRTDAHMLEKGELSPERGMGHLREFLNERWKGQRPILWNGQLARAEFLEALHCGLLGLEL